MLVAPKIPKNNKAPYGLPGSDGGEMAPHAPRGVKAFIRAKVTIEFSQNSNIVSNYFVISAVYLYCYA